jgi:energy-coupling factor transporter transmembrane protein EcfT
LKILAPILVFISLITLLLYRWGDPTPVLNLPFHIKLWGGADVGIITRGALLYACIMLLRILTFIFAVPVILLTTTLGKLLAGLSRLKIPYFITFLLGCAATFAPLVFEAYELSCDAQKLRAYEPSKLPLKEKVKTGWGRVPSLVPLLLTLFRGITDLSIVIQSRAISPEGVMRTYVEESKLGISDYCFLALLICYLIVSLMVLWYYVWL